MTMFGDQLYQNGGAPVGLPVTFGTTQNKGAGTVWFVNSNTGSDGNTGKRMDKPFATIAKAYAQAVTNNHDMIVLSANSALAESDELTVAKNRLHFWGMDAVGRYYGQRSRWTMGVTTGTAIGIVQNTGVGNSFSNIKFDSADTLSTSKYAFAEGGEYTVLENCEIYSSGQVSVASAAQLLMNGDSALIRHCTIGSLATAMTAANTNVLLTRETIAGKVCRDVTFDNCLFWLKSTSATASHMHATTATDVERMLLIKNSLFVVAKLSSATVGDAIIVDAAQTEGEILILNSPNANSTALATTGAVGVFYQGPELVTAATAGNMRAVTD